MPEDREKTGNTNSVVVSLILTAVILPCALIAVAVLEEVLLLTHNVTNLYRQLGIFEPLDWLLDNTLGRLFY